ncbi:MAG: ribonuclease P protein component [Acidimicrobiales bacterium]
MGQETLGPDPVHDGASCGRARPAKIRGRSDFSSLVGSRRRARSGPVAVHYLAAMPGDETRRFAYSVPRRVGSAVERNRHRRRLRAVAFEVAPIVPPGAYLIGLGSDAGAVSFEELRTRVIESIKAATGTGMT